MENTRPRGLVLCLIVANEFCERYCFYGFRSLLFLFCRQSFNMSEAKSAGTVHFFIGASYMFTFLGGLASDAILGRYRTILYMSLIYFLGTTFTTLSAVNLSEKALAFGLFLIALGTGGIKPCVSTFGGDQFVGTDERYVKIFFDVFYFTINAGSLLSIFVSPIVAECKCFGKETCYPIAFGVPMVLLAISIIFFWIGRDLYISKPPDFVLYNIIFKRLCNLVLRKFNGKLYRLKNKREDSYFFKDLENLHEDIDRNSFEEESEKNNSRNQTINISKKSKQDLKGNISHGVSVLSNESFKICKNSDESDDEYQNGDKTCSPLVYKNLHVQDSAALENIQTRLIHPKELQESKSFIIHDKFVDSIATCDILSQNRSDSQGIYDRYTQSLSQKNFSTIEKSPAQSHPKLHTICDLDYYHQSKNNIYNGMIISNEAGDDRSILDTISDSQDNNVYVARNVESKSFGAQFFKSRQDFNIGDVGSEIYFKTKQRSDNFSFRNSNALSCFDKNNFTSNTICSCENSLNSIQTASIFSSDFDRSYLSAENEITFIEKSNISKYRADFQYLGLDISSSEGISPEKNIGSLSLASGSREKFDTNHLKSGNLVEHDLIHSPSKYELTDICVESNLNFSYIQNESQGTRVDKDNMRNYGHRTSKNDGEMDENRLISPCQIYGKKPAQLNSNIQSYDCDILISTERDLSDKTIDQEIQKALRVLKTFIYIPFFWMLYDQQSTTWIEQGTKMQENVYFMGFSVIVRPEQMQALNGVLILGFIPLFSNFLYPLLQSKGYNVTSLNKMCCGMVLASLSFIAAALLEVFTKYNPSILWQTPQYVLLTAGEIMLSLTGIEFVYNEAPERLKGLLLSGWLMTVAAGNLYVVLFTSMNILKWLSFRDPEIGNYLLYAGIGLIASYYFKKQSMENQRKTGSSLN